MQTKLLGCLGGWLLIVSLSQAQTPATPPPAQPASEAQAGLPAGAHAGVRAAVPAPAASSVSPAEDGGRNPLGLFSDGALEVKGRDAPCLWVSADYLLWFIRSGPLPVALLTANNDLTTIAAQNQTGTQVLFGSGSSNGLNFGALSGGRFTVGGWVDSGRSLGFEASGFVLQNSTISYSASSDGINPPIVGVPFSATIPFGPNDIGIPAPLTGANPSGANFALGETTLNNGTNPASYQVSAKSQFYGVEANALIGLAQGDFAYWQLLVGFRNLDLVESIGLQANLTDPLTGGTATLNDGFSTRNTFAGAQLGTRLGCALGRFAVEGAVKLALGNTAETLNISGTTNISNNAFGVPTGSYAGGIFAQPSNIGSTRRNVFTAVPEFQLQGSYAINDFISCNLGFNFLYATGWMRPGDQISRNVDITQNVLFGGTPGMNSNPLNPLAPLKTSDFWATGFSFGFEVRF